MFFRAPSFKVHREKSVHEREQENIISPLIFNVETKNLYVRNLWIEPVNMRQGVGACGRVKGHVAGSQVVVGGQAYSIDGDMWQGWDGVVGCEDMWQGVGQGVGACGRVWGHMAGVNVSGRGSGLQHRQRHVAGVGTCGRVWKHVAGCWACGRGGCRVWGHVSGVWVFGRGSGL